MTVKVLYFSSLQDLVGASEIEETLAEGRAWTLADLLETLFERHPKLRDWDGRLLLAINQEWAERDQPLAPGDEVAIMPPVQGG